MAIAPGNEDSGIPRLNGYWMSLCLHRFGDPTTTSRAKRLITEEESCGKRDSIPALSQGGGAFVTETLWYLRPWFIAFLLTPEQGLNSISVLAPMMHIISL